ncbi:hypothetical protein [Amycolatopsis panacis]|uniref:Uncharacterized protein n=1 Tax=Amycolatopsis panacis TaxID=2340917 RepID=A0A419I839_9PSEU|nr:hypothetical protein [Amycolatopsis panacis]RJQ88247.1 hypothetical protein D5S19_08080 [Amycolatopsis panacis]
MYCSGVKSGDSPGRATGALAIVLFGHGRALRALGVPRIAFTAQIWALFEQVLEDLRPVPGPRLRARPRGPA